MVQKIVYIYGVPYIVKSETKCFVNLQECEETYIAVLDHSKVRVMMLEPLDKITKMKKEKIDNIKGISLELNINTEYIIYNSSATPKKLDHDTEINQLILDCLNNPNYERLFQFWDFIKMKQSSEYLEDKEERDELKRYMEDFKPYVSEIFKITNFKL